MSTPPSSSSPHPPLFRPSPARATTLAGTTILPPYRGPRAASQPPGERIPGSSLPTSGRGSPGMNGGGSAFGAIGSARAPGRFGSALAESRGFGGAAGGGGGVGGIGTQTRANSFSAAEMSLPRNTSLTRTLSSHAEELLPSRSHSTSPFPTFSPNSTPSTSPIPSNPHPLPPSSTSPSKPHPNPSRSRSQSLAVGVRPHPQMMSAIEPHVRAFDWPEPQDSNMSPFSRHMPSTFGSPGLDGYPSAPRRNGTLPTPQTQASRFRSPQLFGGAGWGSSAPETNTNSALSSSVAKVLGSVNQPPYSTVIGGFGDPSPGANANGSRSGTSSRRHSVSVVGGPGGRPRDMLFGEHIGGGMSMISPPTRGIGPLGFTDAELLPEKLGNALNLEIDRQGKQREEEQRGRAIPSSAPRVLPMFDPVGGAMGERFGSRGRQQDSGGFGAVGGRDAGERRAGSGESKDGSGSARSRFSFEQGGGTDFGPGAGGGGGGGGFRGRDVNPAGHVGAPVQSGPGPIGSPVRYDPRVLPGPPGAGAPGYGPPPPGMFRPAYAPPPPLPNQQAYGRPPPPGSMGTYGAPGSFYPRPPPPPAWPSSQQQQSMTSPPPFSHLPPAPQAQPGSPNSPSFSTLSLSDLGRGVPLASLPPTTPLYVVSFKATRRDVYYCPDPTLLISNGDRVIVEADRGSDLGTVVFDQLTPLEVREWQEKVATAALLSGAREHLPPGMRVEGGMMRGGAGSEAGAALRVGKRGGALEGMDLGMLLSGAGANGMGDPSSIGGGGGGVGGPGGGIGGGGGLGGGGMQRGQLVKEIMPKRIFAKSAAGPEENARMMEKMKDEYDAMMICREKVAQRGLPMQIVDAEYQWDRRKLTFYFKADKRVDFRDLTKENFRIFKSRIWMSMVSKDDPRG